MQQLHMVKPGEKILVALSGGADSVCLLCMLLSVRSRLDFSVEAAHINHMLRDTAGRDELFVKELCKANGIPLHTLHADVAAIAQREGLSFEEAGRNIRYDFLQETADKIGAAKIAVAHHLNDSAETILFHMCRGTGIDGLAGIRPVRDEVIRPLLCLDRAQIETYLEEIGQAYMTDETNADNHYSRNRIRNEILPMMDEVCSGAALHIAQAGELAADISDYLKLQISKALQDCVQISKDEIHLVCSAWQQLHVYMQGEVIRECIYQLSGSKKDISKVHMDAVCNLATCQVGSKCDLPYAIEVLKSYDSFIFLKKNEIVEEVRTVFWADVDMSGLSDGIKMELPNGSVVHMRLINYNKSMNIPTKSYTKWLDYDKIDEPLVIRTPAKDDFFYFDNKNKKYVKDYMVNEKIPLADRDKSVIVASGSHMLYFIGKRISNYVKIDEMTTRILEIEVTGG